MSQNSPHGSSDGHSTNSSSDLPTTGEDDHEDVNIGTNNERILTTPSPVFEVEVSEQGNKPTAPTSDFQLSETPTDQSSNSSPINDDRHDNNTTPDSIPRTSASTPSDSSVDLLKTPEYENNNINSMTRNTTCPAIELKSPLPSPISERQSSTPSPVDWLHFDPTSPAGKEEKTNLKNKDTHSKTTVNQDAMSNGSISTPSPIDWEGVTFSNTSDKVDPPVGSKELRQLTTPSPMSVSSDEFAKEDNPLSPVSVNSTEGNILTKTDDHKSSILDTERNNNAHSKINDSGFVSSSVSPVVNMIQSPATLVRNSTAFKSLASGVRKNTDSQVVDLTSPEFERSHVNSGLSKLLKDPIATSANLKQLAFSPGRVASQNKNLTVANSSMTFPTLGQSSQSSLFPANNSQMPKSVFSKSVLHKTSMPKV